MHVLFVHPSYPAQFGRIAAELAVRYGWKCSFLTCHPPGLAGKVELIPYRAEGSATPQTHFCARPFENTVWHADGVYKAMAARPDVRPDLVVGHSGFSSTLFLRELYPSTPIINYFEYFYRPRGQDIDFRPEFPPDPADRLRAMTRNAAILLDLENCAAGYAPTRWQRDRLPAEFRPKVQVLFDGVDTDLWRPPAARPRTVAGVTFPDDVKVVTYASRGLEAMRGFDVFMRFAKKLGERRRDVVFAVAGRDRVYYGGDERFTRGKTFRDWVLSRDDYDLSRFAFLGHVPEAELAALFGRSDLHVYLTAPFILSWSLFDAMACGALVLASRTGPVEELVADGRTGLLRDFFDVDGMAAAAESALDRPGDYGGVRAAAAEHIRAGYGLETCLPRLRAFYENVTTGRTS